MRPSRIALTAVAAAALAALAAPAAVQAHPDQAPAAAPAKTFSYDFAAGAQGWEADFAEFSAATNRDSMELDFGIRPLPSGTATGDAFYIQGHNRSDDIFMFLRRKLGPADGIVPGKTYSVRSSVSFWSTAPAGGCPGSGGSMGASVHVKAGASTEEPRVKLNANRYYEVALKKGQQSQGGEESAVIGDVANGQPCGGPKKWAKVTRASRAATPLTVQADAQGYLWLNAGTDSGYEGITQLYYSNITTTLTPR